MFTNECTVQLDSHGRLCFRKKNEARALKQRPKHPIKIHVWGGISARGATKIVMFSRIMNAIKYGKIVEEGLVPFMKAYFPDGHRLQQDNDLKHSSRYIKPFLFKPFSSRFFSSRFFSSHQAVSSRYIKPLHSSRFFFGCVLGWATID